MMDTMSNVRSIAKPMMYARLSKEFSGDPGTSGLRQKKRNAIWSLKTWERFSRKLSAPKRFQRKPKPPSSTRGPSLRILRYLSEKSKRRVRGFDADGFCDPPFVGDASTLPLCSTTVKPHQFHLLLGLTMGVKLLFYGVLKSAQECFRHLVSV